VIRVLVVRVPWNIFKMLPVRILGWLGSGGLGFLGISKTATVDRKLLGMIRVRWFKREPN